MTRAAKAPDYGGFPATHIVEVPTTRDIRALAMVYARRRGLQPTSAVLDPTQDTSTHHAVVLTLPGRATYTQMVPK